jgi:hypothetical protein
VTWARTDRADYLFVVSEEGEPDYRPFITVEPIHGALRTLRGCTFGFDLKSGTTMKEAEEFARFLNDNIETVFMTVFSEEPLA